MNVFEIISKYSQFQQMLKQCGKNPETLLEEEMKRRNISPSQLQDLIQQAKQMKKLLGVK